MSIVITRSVTSADDQVQKLLNVFYPVGSYYETSDTSFDPNTAWGGTWVEDTAGKMLVAKDTSTFSTVGDTGGAESHQHEIGLRTAGYWGELGLENNTTGLLIYDAAGNTTVGGRDIVATGNRNFNSSTTSAVSTLNSGDFEFKGSSKYETNLPPYIVIKRWHRTA